MTVGLPSCVCWQLQRRLCLTAGPEIAEDGDVEECYPLHVVLLSDRFRSGLCMRLPFPPPVL